MELWVDDIFDDPEKMAIADENDFEIEEGEDLGQLPEAEENSDAGAFLPPSPSLPEDRAGDFGDDTTVTSDIEEASMLDDPQIVALEADDCSLGLPEDV
ncbi:hypothetical protein LRP88_02159 [Fusarium phalaenopsidis]